MTARSLGFVDYNLDNYHANTFLDLINNDLARRGWRVTRCWAIMAAEGRVWAERRKVNWVEDPGEMSGCDGIMVLAPSNPETHLSLAEHVFPLGRPVYIDKTFAPDFKTANAIFALADAAHVPVFTASALRFSAKLRAALRELGQPNVRHVQAWGGGGNFDEYLIHPLEMVVSALGPEARRFFRLDDGLHHQVQIEFKDGRTGTVFVHVKSECRFQAVLSTDAKTVHVDCHADPIFRDLCAAVLDFFETGLEPAPRAESLAISLLREKALRAKPTGRWTPLTAFNL